MLAPMSRRSAQLPSFALYGEASASVPPVLHLESIQSRSSQYAWEIHAHVHQGLHQVVWLRAGPGEVILDESRSQFEGPVAVVIPPGVAHAFRFSPASDGQVLTLSAAALAEGDAAGVGEALQNLFAAPRTLLPELAETERLSALFACLQTESLAADQAAVGEGAVSPVPLWLARALVWQLAQWARRADLPANRSGQGQRALYTRWVVLVEANYRAHWPVSRYAERLGLSEERLNRMVKAETGLTAQTLLHAGCSPRDYRRRMQVGS
jgi:AraC family transcriptional activator of pobA